jgi:hypothetical protein
MRPPNTHTHARATGITLDVVLVTLICPKAVIGGAAPAKAGQSALARWAANIPAAALEAGQKGAWGGVRRAGAHGAGCVRWRVPARCRLRHDARSTHTT